MCRSIQYFQDCSLIVDYHVSVITVLITSMFECKMNNILGSVHVKYIY